MKKRRICSFCNKNFEVKINTKIEQNYKWMNYVSNIVAKNDPIAIYYKMIMHRKFKGFYDNEDYNKKNL